MSRHLPTRSLVVVAGLTVAGLFVAPVAAYAGKPVKGGTTADRTAPLVGISSPTAGATVSSPFTVAGTASDNTAVGKVTVSLDGSTPTNASGTSSWTWSSPAVAAGSHTVNVTAYDTSGNVAAASVTVSVPAPAPVDSTAPQVSVLTPAAGSTVSASFTATGTASDDTSLASVAVKVDAGTWQPASGTSSWTFPVDASSLADGSHTLTARATDGAGNVSTTSRAFTLSRPAQSASDVVLNDPSAANPLALLGRGTAASWGSVSVVLYWEQFTNHRSAFLRDSSTGAQSYVRLPVDNESGWSHAAYTMTSPTDLWVFGGGGPMALRHFSLSGGSLPTTATLVSDQAVGDSDSRQGDFIRLADGALVLSWLQQGATGPQGQWLGYVPPASTTLQVSGPLTFVRTKASKSVLAQHPVDGSVWLFSDPDAWGAVAVAHLTEASGSLRVDWTDPTWINTTAYGENGPDPENPDLVAGADPTTGTIVLAYQGAHRMMFQTSPTVVTGSYPVVARIAASGSLAFTQLPVYVERISSLAMSVVAGDVRLTYRPIDATTMTFDHLDSALLHAGTWSAAAHLGQLADSWEVLSFTPGRSEVAAQMSDGQLHLFLP